MRVSEKDILVKGQITPEEVFELFFTIVIVVIALAFAWNMFQDSSDNYVEREKYDNAQSKISKLQNTIDSKNQRIDNLEDWKENYSVVKQENQDLKEQVNQSDTQEETKFEVKMPTINIDYPWGISVAALAGLIIGIITPTSVIGVKGYFRIPVPEIVATLLREQDETD